MNEAKAGLARLESAAAKQQREGIQGICRALSDYIADLEAEIAQLRTRRQSAEAYARTRRPGGYAAAKVITKEQRRLNGLKGAARRWHGATIMQPTDSAS